MSIASSERTRAHSVSGLTPKKSYDVRFLVSMVIVAVGVVVAGFALATHPGVGPDEFASMIAVPP
jgi:hypothetical protein